MRRFVVGNPPFNTVKQPPEMRFVLQSLKEIERSSMEDYAADAADGISVSNFTETRTLNAGTATLADVANVLATFLNDIQKRGSKRRS